MAFDAPELTTGFYSLGVADSATIAAGTLGAVNASGYATPGADTAGLRIVGRAEEDVDNSAGSDGDLSATFKPGIFKFDNSSTDALTIAHIGQTAFVEDATTVAADSTNHVPAGRVVRVDSDGVYVDTRHTGEIHVGYHDADGLTLTAADSGKLVSNLGASGAAAYVLPAAVPGLEFHFAVKVAQQLRIDPDGTETIELPSTAAQQAAGKYIVADAIGEFIHLRCLVAGAWAVVASAGTWTAEA